METAYMRNGHHLMELTDRKRGRNGEQRRGGGATVFSTAGRGEEQRRGRRSFSTSARTGNSYSSSGRLLYAQELEVGDEAATGDTPRRALCAPWRARAFPAGLELLRLTCGVRVKVGATSKRLGG